VKLNQKLIDEIRIHNETPRHWWKAPGRPAELVVTDGHWLTIQPMPEGLRLKTDKSSNGALSTWRKLRAKGTRTVDFDSFLRWVVRRGPKREDCPDWSEGTIRIRGDYQEALGVVFDRCVILEAVQPIIRGARRRVPASLKIDLLFTDRHMLRIASGAFMGFVCGTQGASAGDDPCPR